MGKGSWNRRVEEDRERERKGRILGFTHTCMLLNVILQ